MCQKWNNYSAVSLGRQPRYSLAALAVQQVLRSASLKVKTGTLHILAGANGCGKSTLLRILGRLLTLQSGNVSTIGEVGMVLQNPDHQIVMPTVGAEVAFGLGKYVAFLDLWILSAQG